MLVDWVRVDLNFGCFTVCPILPGLMGIWQKWLDSWARWVEHPNQSQPTQGPRALGTPCNVNLSPFPQRATTRSGTWSRAWSACRWCTSSWRAAPTAARSPSTSPGSAPPPAPTTDQSLRRTPPSGARFNTLRHHENPPSFINFYQRAEPPLINGSWSKFDGSGAVNVTCPEML